MAVRELEEEGGDGYFASISDLMVGILFVFLLMLTVFALHYREAEDEQKVSREKFEMAEQKADRLRKLLEQAAAEVRREIEDRAAARNRLLAKLQTALAERSIPVRVDWQAGILHLQESVLFQPSEASLGSEQRKTVDRLADALMHTLPCFTTITDRTSCDQSDPAILETVLIEGHTDKRPIVSGRYRDNDQLSTERALAVFGELLRMEPGLEELRNADGTYPLLGVSGFGARRPLPEAQRDTDADYALNRRIDLRFILAARSSAELERLNSEIENALTESAR
jgi:flagellar motor protein MotB